jgi:hypothetical protein
LVAPGSSTRSGTRARLEHTRPLEHALGPSAAQPPADTKGPVEALSALRVQRRVRLARAGCRDGRQGRKSDHGLRSGPHTQDP